MRVRIKLNVILCGFFVFILCFTYWYMTTDKAFESSFEYNWPKQPNVLLRSFVDSQSVKKLEPLQCKPQLSLVHTDIRTDHLRENFLVECTPGDVNKRKFNITYSLSDWDNYNLEVVILPHSFEDPGFSTTLEDHFARQTRLVLNAAADFLEKNSDARFIFDDVAFLNMWWKELSPSGKTLFTKLVRDGRWEIATGVWVPNDEATTHYAATISQLTEGHHWLLDNLGYSPNVSWAINSFGGHSATTTYLLGKAAINNILINRVNFELKRTLAAQGNLEFYWRQSWAATSRDGDVFTHVMPFNGHSVAHTCGPDLAICCQFDFGHSNSHCPEGVSPSPISESNLQERAKVLVHQYRMKAKLFDNRGVLFVPLGDDSRYTNSVQWDAQVSSYRRLMKHINADPSYRMHIQFGTLSDYFRMVHSRKPSSEFPTFSGDLFSSAQQEDQDPCGRGYFHGRLAAVETVPRYFEGSVRTADLLFSLARHWEVGDNQVKDIFPKLFQMLTVARRGLALTQHRVVNPLEHSSAKVRADYRTKLQTALTSAQVVSAASAAFLLGYESKGANSVLDKHVHAGEPPILLSADPSWLVGSGLSLFNISFDKLDDQKVFYLFNPLPSTRECIFSVNVDLTELIRALKRSDRPLGTLRVEVSLTDNSASNSPSSPVLHQLEPTSSSTTGSSSSFFRLIAGPLRLAPLQIVRVTVKPLVEGSGPTGLQFTKPMLYKFPTLSPLAESFHLHADVDSLEPELESDYLKLEFDRKTGFSRTLHNKRTGRSHGLDIKFEIVRSVAAAAASSQGLHKTVAEGEFPQLRLVRGSVVEEVTSFYPQLEHTLRLHKAGTPGRYALEVENLVNLTAVSFEHQGQEEVVEVVMTLDTNIDNTDGIFFTDSNCLQMTRLQYLPTSSPQNSLHPMTCAVYIESGHTRITLLSVQALGVTVGQRPGQLRVQLAQRHKAAKLEEGTGEAKSPTTREAVPVVSLHRSLFRVIVEEVFAESVLPMHSLVPALTDEARYALNDLNNPTTQFLLTGVLSRDQLSASRHLMSPRGLRCDYDLVAMKTFNSESERYQNFGSVLGNQLGLVLHRHFAACGSTYLCDKSDEMGSVCMCSSSSHPEQKVEELFPDLTVKVAVRTPLNLIPLKNTSAHQTTSISVPPMEVEAFLLLPRPPSSSSSSSSKRSA